MKIFNSLTGKKDFFRPLKKQKVKMYVCGITPYDTTHLGHAFTYIIFDAFYRYLKYKGYRVKYTQNVTDIDDDILKKAKETGKDWKELGNFWTEKFISDLKWLNILLPDKYVKATDSIGEIIKINKKLEKKGFAYKRKGNLYFEVQKFKGYGKLSKLKTEEMLKISKERGADPNDPLKKNPLDFILWQRLKKGEPFWESPWGKGRPGWHIECSAMVNKYLGNRIDLHGGGYDLIYPHHESEIAQSESYLGKLPFSKYWMHIAMVSYQGQKMSKSLGNLIMVSDLRKKYKTNELRYFLLKHHYAKIWEFTYKELDILVNEFKQIKKIVNSEKNGMDFAELSKLLEDNLNIPGVFEKILTGNTNGAGKILKILGFSFPL